MSDRKRFDAKALSRKEIAKEKWMPVEAACEDSLGFFGKAKVGNQRTASKNRQVRNSVNEEFFATGPDS